MSLMYLASIPFNGISLARSPPLVPRRL